MSCVKRLERYKPVKFKKGTGIVTYRGGVKFGKGVMEKLHSKDEGPISKEILKL